MRFFAIVPKLFSLLIAGLDVYAMYLSYQHEKADRFGVPLYGEDGVLVLSILWAVVVIGSGLACIWFSEDISEFAEQSTESRPYGDWAPTGLIKFVGWAFLLVPAILFIWHKMK